MDVDLVCWMKTLVLPHTSTTDVIDTCLFAVPADRVPSRDAVVVVVWAFGFKCTVGSFSVIPNPWSSADRTDLRKSADMNGLCHSLHAHS